MESAVFSIFRFGLYDSGDQTQPKRESMAAYYELEFYGEEDLQNLLDALMKLEK